MSTIREEIGRLRELFIAKTGGMVPNRLNIPPARQEEFTRAVYVSRADIAAGKPVLYLGMRCSFTGAALDVIHVAVEA
jgi:hypothetical protein